MPGLKGEDAQIYATDQADSTSMSAEPMSDTGDGVTYQIDDAAKNIFDPDVTFTVSDSGGTVAASTYTIRYLSGVVVFDSAPTDPVTINGSYLPKHILAKGFETEATLSNNMLDFTRFGDDAPRRDKGLRDLTASFGSYEVLEANIDANGDDDGPSLDDVLLESGSTDGEFVFRYSPDDTDTQMVTAIVELEEASNETATGGKQSKSYSLAVDETPSAMATQPSVNVDVLSL